MSLRKHGYCTNPPCGIGPVELFAGLCRTCYQFQYRTGKPRPTELVMANSARVMERIRWNRIHG
jgi:hypothetical protein